MKYFTLEEFTRSETAKKYNINNTPSSEQINNIKEFVEVLLDPLREDWGKYCKQNNLGSQALRITSGVRSKLLNDKVGGSKTSSHYIGSAADIVPYNNKLREFKSFCVEWLKDKEFDQMISENENSKGVPQWIHIGYKRYNGAKRCQFLKSLKGIKNKYYPLG